MNQTIPLDFIRPIEERLRTNTYNMLEYQMVINGMNALKDQIEPTWRSVLESLSIRKADILLNGAPN